MSLKKTLSNVGVIISILFLATSLYSQQTQYIAKKFIDNTGDTLLYRQLQPETIIKDEKYPLILFLHGAGERGSDNISQLQNGSMQFTNPVNREKYPSFVVFPQCPADKYWAPSSRPEKFEKEYFPLDEEVSQPLGMVERLLSQLVSEYPIDTDRIYVIGLSMGGMGTYDIVCRNPDTFAAAVAICGAVNEQRLHQINSKTNFRLYHGDEDSVVPVFFSREAYKALKESGKRVEYFEFPGVNHGSWNPAFNQPDFISWIYNHTLLKE